MSVLPGPGAGADPLDAARRIADDLAQRAATLAAATRRLRRREHAEAVHDVRVAARRLAAALALWRALLRRRARRRTLRGLRRLGRRLGPVREREVVLALLEARATRPGEETREVVERLAARLRRRIARARTGVARACRPAAIERLVRGVTRAAGRLETRVGAQPDWRARAEQRVETLGVRARDALAEGLASREDAALHQARIAVKRWRYAGECVEAVAGAPATRLVPLRELQETLGAVHDLATLRDRLVRAAARSARRRRGFGAPASGGTAPISSHDPVAALSALAQAIEEDRARALERLRVQAASLAR